MKTEIIVIKIISKKANTMDHQKTGERNIHS